MKIISTRRLTGILGCLLALVLIISAATPALAVPQVPHQFWGQVTIDELQADGGITVLAKIGGEEYSTTTDAQGRYGYTTEEGGTGIFRVPADDPDTSEKEGGTNGEIIEFYVDDVLATTFPFQIGSQDELPLSIAAPVDLTDLDAAITSAQALTEADYTAGSWADLQTALTAALLVQADAEATQVEVDAATTALTDAIAALEFAGQADLDTAVAAAGALTEADYTAGSWADLVTALALPETTNAEVVAKTTAINDAIAALVVIGDITDPVIEYAGLICYTGAESARPGDSFEVVATVTDNTGVTLVELETPFGTFPLDVEVYEGVAIYWVVIEVPEDATPGTYDLNLIAEDAAGNTATRSLDLEVVLSLTAYNVWLTDGWNLISLPLIPDDTDTETVLDGLSFLGEDMTRAVWGDEDADEMMPAIDKVWHYDAAGEYGPSGEWLFFDPAAPEVGDLHEMEDGKGYWVEVVAVVDEEVAPPIITVHGVELVSGPTLPPTYAVAEGWNLIGFKEARPMHFSEYLSAVEGKYARIYVYDAYEQRFYIVGEGDLDYMQPCAGYWIYMTDAGYIVP